MSEYKEGIDASGRVSEGIGDGNSFHRLQEWYDYAEANTYKKVDAEFISNVWRILDSAGNLLISKHHDYGPKNIAHFISVELIMTKFVAFFCVVVEVKSINESYESVTGKNILAAMRRFVTRSKAELDKWN